MSKVPGLQPKIVSGLQLGSPGKNSHSDVVSVASYRVYYKGGRWWLPPSPGRGESCVSHYNKKGAYCDPNILANNKEIRFRKPVVPNKNSSQTLKPLRNPHLYTRTIASSSQLPKLNQSQHIFDYNVFYTRFAIHNTSKIIENKPNIATT